MGKIIHPIEAVILINSFNIINPINSTLYGAAGGGASNFSIDVSRRSMRKGLFM